MEKEHLEVILESIDSKFDLVLEGHETLNQKIDDLAKRTDERFDLVDIKIDTLNDKIDTVDKKLTKRIDGLNDKIDAVSVDLKAHRADTEAHHGVYRVKEG
ncbi:MAG: hypothetical protein L3J57_13095 [Desulfuromusa sp.]|nr:hypothetical protein [Desulfuromusa sp.]